MRRATILLLLLAAMAVIQPLGIRGQSETTLTFGLLMLAAYTIGEVAVTVGLPRIVGYLATGMILGPSALGVVGPQAAAELAPVSRLAIALIAFLAGAELQWKEVRSRGVTILKLMSAELGLQLVAVLAVLLLLREWVPFLAGRPWGETVALAGLFATMTIIHSPAVTMAILSETRAGGPVARTTLGIVLLADVAVILMFSAALGVARAVVPSPGAQGVSAGVLAWELLGALVVGGALGGIAVLYLRFVQRELLLFAVLVALLGAEVARILHVETLLTLLVAGFIAENVSPHGTELRHAMERSAAPVFVVFFALAGAALDLRAVLELWPLVVPLVLVRSAAIWGGVALGGRWAKTTREETRGVWMGLVSQAGVAIGLATVVAEAYPRLGSDIRTLFLAVMTVNQVVGPVLFRRALDRAGESRPHLPAAPPPGAVEAPSTA